MRLGLAAKGFVSLIDSLYRSYRTQVLSPYDEHTEAQRDLVVGDGMSLSWWDSTKVRRSIQQDLGLFRFQTSE